MKTLAELIADARTKHDALKSLALEAPEGWESQHEKGMAEYDALLNRIEKVKALENAAPPAAPEEKPLKSLAKNPAEAADKPEGAGGNEKGAPYVSKDMDKYLALNIFKAITFNDQAALKDLGVTSSPRGGWMLPVEVSSMVIKRLESALVFDKLGVTFMPISNQSLVIPAENSDMTGYWVGEHQTRTATDFTGGSITLNLHYAAAATVISKLLLNSSAQAQVQELILRRITNRLRRLVELAYFTGIGAVPSGSSNTGTQPRGLINIPNVQSFGVGATLNGDNTVSSPLSDGGRPSLVDFSRLMQMVEVSDVPDMGTRAWVMHPRQKAILREMADQNGRHYFVENVSNQREPALLYGYPVYTTTQIPINVTTGSSTDTSYIFFGEWENFLIGNGPTLQIESSDQVNFMQSQVVYKGEIGTDCNVTYPQAFAYMTGVRTVS